MPDKPHCGLGTWPTICWRGLTSGCGPADTSLNRSMSPGAGTEVATNALASRTSASGYSPASAAQSGPHTSLDVQQRSEVVLMRCLVVRGSEDCSVDATGDVARSRLRLTALRDRPSASRRIM